MAEPIIGNHPHTPEPVPFHCDECASLRTTAERVREKVQEDLED